MTIQEQDQVAAVLDFVDESYNGYVDRHEALHCTARDGEKHACQMFRLHWIQTEQTSKRALQTSPDSNTVGYVQCQQFGRCYDVRGGLEAVASICLSVSSLTTFAGNSEKQASP
jgi:hypothetical protein